MRPALYQKLLCRRCFPRLRQGNKKFVAYVVAWRSTVNVGYGESDMVDCAWVEAQNRLRKSKKETSAFKGRGVLMWWIVCSTSHQFCVSTLMFETRLCHESHSGLGKVPGVTPMHYLTHYKMMWEYVATAVKSAWLDYPCVHGFGLFCVDSCERFDAPAYVPPPFKSRCGKAKRRPNSTSRTTSFIFCTSDL